MKRFGFLPLSIAVMLIVAIPRLPAHAQTPKCFGQAATLVGTQGGDKLEGTSGPDVIVGLGGNDSIHGQEGDDLICLGGNKGGSEERGYGDEGDDKINGGAGRDFLDGGPEDDRLIGGRGPDFILARNGLNVLKGGLGKDSLVGGGQADRLWGGEGNDLESGRAGPDVLFGGRGGDGLAGMLGDDLIRGGGGRDIADFGSLGAAPYHFKDMSVNLARGSAKGLGRDRLIGMEGAITSFGKDRLIGDSGPNVLAASSGGGVVRGGRGRDTFKLYGVEYPTHVVVNLARNVVRNKNGVRLVKIYSMENAVAAAAPSTLIGNDKRNRLVGGVAFDYGDVSTIFGRGGRDVLIGHDNVRDVLEGNHGKDRLIGRGDKDSLDGGRGRDRSDGGSGTDRCVNPDAAHGARNCERP